MRHNAQTVLSPEAPLAEHRDLVREGALSQVLRQGRVRQAAEVLEFRDTKRDKSATAPVRIIVWSYGDLIVR